jgi:peptide-methionine (S)-S-oxide reductase
MVVSISDSDAAPALPPMDRNAPEDTVTATVALGCFWGPDALFGALDGVVRTCVGYAGGTTPDPTYEALGDHIEAVRIEYDPAQIDYAALLDRFWRAHDPTRAPFKRQYQPALFPHTDDQAEQARKSAAEVAERAEAAITTEIIEDASFYRAEAYHQKHKLRRHTELMEAIRPLYPNDEAFADSPAAALVNGYVGGYRVPQRLEADGPRLGLPPGAEEVLHTIVENRHS